MTEKDKMIPGELFIKDGEIELNKALIAEAPADQSTMGGTSP